MRWCTPCSRLRNWMQQSLVQRVLQSDTQWFQQLSSLLQHLSMRLELHLGLGRKP